MLTTLRPCTRAFGLRDLPNLAALLRRREYRRAAARFAARHADATLPAQTAALRARLGIEEAAPACTPPVT